MALKQELKKCICSVTQKICFFISDRDSSDFHGTYDDEIDLELCFSYFFQNYTCYLLHLEDEGFSKNYFSSFYNSKLSFKELEHLQDESKVFNIKKKKMGNSSARNYNIISAYTGFALLFRSSDLLELYYYDIENNFTSCVDIPFFNEKYDSEMKVVNRTVWLVTKKEGSYFLDAVCVKK